MVTLAGLEHERQAAERRVNAALSSGRALQVFTRMIEHQGGNPRIADDYALLPSAPDRANVVARRDGYLSSLAAEAIGRATHALGAGRSRASESIDHGVGIVLKVKPADAVRSGDVLLDLHHRGGRNLEAALALCEEAIVISDEPPPRRARVLGSVN
jgi:thymidine phosphorylase